MELEYEYVVALTAWMAEEGYSAQEVADAVEKPWKYMAEMRQAVLWWRDPKGDLPPVEDLQELNLYARFCRSSDPGSQPDPGQWEPFGDRYPVQVDDRGRVTPIQVSASMDLQSIAIYNADTDVPLVCVPIGKTVQAGDVLVDEAKDRWLVTVVVPFMASG